MNQSRKMWKDMTTNEKLDDLNISVKSLFSRVAKLHDYIDRINRATRPTLKD